MPKTEHWVKYLYPGTLMSESEYKRLEARSVDQALAACNPGAFAFQLYDVLVKTAMLEDGEAIEKRIRQNESGRYYPGGVLKTLEDVKAMGKAYEILASDMECNGWGLVVRSRRGNYQPFDMTDEVLP